MRKIHALSLILLLVMSSLSLAQTSRSRNVTVAANQSWPRFLTAFRAAVNKRDRDTLRGMIAIPFLTQVDGELKSPDEVFKWLNLDNGWAELQKEVRPTAKFTDPSGKGVQRCAKNGIFCFKFESDGHWRLSEQGENEGD